MGIPICYLNTSGWAPSCYKAESQEPGSSFSRAERSGTEAATNRSYQAWGRIPLRSPRPYPIPTKNVGDGKVSDYALVVAWLCIHNRS